VCVCVCVCVCVGVCERSWDCQEIRMLHSTVEIDVVNEIPHLEQIESKVPAFLTLTRN